MKNKIVILSLFIFLISIIVYNFPKNDNNKKENSISNLNSNESIAVYISDDNGNYVSTKDIPSEDGDYTFSKAVCNEGIEAKWDEEDWALIVPNKAYFKCNLYFDKNVVSEYILANKTITTRTDFTERLTGDTTGTIYQAEDDDGISYYYAGNPTDNWVKFAGHYWRIIRINGDGSIRIIYHGSSISEESNIDLSVFNNNSDDNMYVGYMYTSGELHGLGTDSTIKSVLETWYSDNLEDYEKYLNNNAGFCGDRTLSSGTGLGTTYTYYAANGRFGSSWDYAAPTYKCPDKSDLYTIKDASKGNKVLSKPIGLITADEVIYAGGGVSGVTEDYYLYTDYEYWTMSPYFFSTNAFVFYVSTGNLENKLHNVNSESGVRPVINLKSSVKLTGKGTTSNPYEVS